MKLQEGFRAPTSRLRRPGLRLGNSDVLAQLFAAGEPGLRLDADPQYLWQDTARTVAVTTPGQTVAGATDRSGRGNHLHQPTAASRPTYGRMPKRGAVNLLTSTDALSTQTKTVTAAQHTLSFTGTGSVTLSGAATGTLTGTGASNRVSLSLTPTAGGLTLTVSGSVTLAQLQIGAAFDSYQRVGSTIYDVTEDGQPTCHYLSYDGVDDCLYTAANLDLTSTDKVTVWAGARKEPMAAYQSIVELSADSGGNNGTFALLATNPTDGNWTYFLSRGTISTLAFQPRVPPITDVVSGIGNISGDSTVLRFNGAEAGSATGDQGIGPYGSYPLYIGRRGNASLPFTGKMTTLVVRGAATADVGPVEKIIASLTPQVALAASPVVTETKMLLHFDNAATDSSPSAHAPTIVGAPSYSTTIKKFGTHSIFMDGGDRITFPDHADWDLNDVDFTLEAFVYFPTGAAVTNQAFFGQWSNDGNIAETAWFLHLSGGNLTFIQRHDAGGHAQVPVAWTPTPDTWHHVAYVSDTTGRRLYINGVRQTELPALRTIYPSASKLVVGAIGDGNAFPGSDFKGYMDEVRISKGIARYTGATYTVPTAPFS